MSDDPTKLVDQPATPPTQPTIETVLERIHALGEKLSQEIQSVRAEMNQEIQSVRAELSQEIQSVRAELNQNIESLRVEMIDQFATLKAKIDILNREFLDVKAQQERQGNRIGELERQAS